MKNGIVTALAAWLTAATVWGGVTYTATLEEQHELGAAFDTSKVRVWIGDGKAKAEYLETSIPGVNPGDVLLTVDGGATVSLVNLAEKTISPCRVDGVFGSLSGGGPRFTSLLPQVISDVSAALVEKGEGEPVAGRPTVRYKFRVRYLQTRSTPRGDVVTTNVVEQEVWVTEEVASPTPASWPLPLPLRFDKKEIQQPVAKVVVLPGGLPVKAITTRTSTSSEGQERIVHGRFEVLELEVTDVPDAVFAIPEGLQQGEFRPGLPSDRSLRGKRARILDAGPPLHP